MAPSTTQPSIAIIGSGIGGLGLAIGLLKQNVPVTIYEGAAKFDSVGAGIGLGPNALKAMALMDETFAKLYDEIKVGNLDPKRKNEQFEALGAEEGLGEATGWYGGHIGDPKFTRSSAHRKSLLGVMKSLIPEGTVKFNKRVTHISQPREGKGVYLEFHDGEIIKVDTVVGCDGIKGMSRRAVLGSRYPEEVASKYAKMYVYRGIAPIEEAKAIIGSVAENAKWFMAPRRGWAMYPISDGREANIVAFIQDINPWVGEQVARECPREEMLAEFTKFDHRLQKLAELYLKPMKWPLFHHPDTPTYFNDRICLLGDSAHASTPSQAAGAGQGLEDALLLSRILGLVKSPDELGAAFQVYDSIRRPRAQGVVRESYEVAIEYFLEHPVYGMDMQQITDAANKRLPLIWWHNLEADVVRATDCFKLLTSTTVDSKTVESTKPISHSVLTKTDSTASSIEKAAAGNDVLTPLAEEIPVSTNG
ncbi:putative salicylate hydroxylase [Calycina marina]|uniref:Salicylate hydroxylase n=1 Tax=Calycina marina TaxID=1763456 RepID=A0A9P7ZAQ2_9HELO|nr:putative salicylate hydroxylase [Calycina marina]